jgi:endonuclease YncB( thermonuclease family)
MRYCARRTGPQHAPMMGFVGRSILMLAAAAVLAACGGPNLRGLQPGEAAAVTAVFDGDTLQLDGDARVTLTEIVAPGRDEPYAREARAALETLAMGRAAQLAYGGARTAGSTTLAHVFVQTEGGRWLWAQGELVRTGAARVRPRRDNAARTSALLALEEEARDARRGLWALAAYRVRDPDELLAEAASLPGRCGEGPFILLEGVVDRVERTPGGGYFNFGPPGTELRDATARVDPRDFALWAQAASGGPESFTGARVRVRGRAADRGGPLICLEHPAAVERL